MLKNSFLAIRAAILYLSIMVISIIWVPFLYIGLLLPLSARLQMIAAWSRLTMFLTRMICGISYEIIGRENLQSLPAVIFCKHQSAWETLAFYSIVPNVCFILKKELLKIPVFGWGLWTIHPIAIDRKQSLKAFRQVAAEGKDRLKKGLSIVIFPEGTRVPICTHPPFHKSGAAVAKSSGYKIVPIAVNSGHCWPKHSFLKRPGKITLVIGPAISTEDKNIDEINDAAHTWIQSTMEKLERFKPDERS